MKLTLTCLLLCLAAAIAGCETSKPGEATPLPEAGPPKEYSSKEGPNDPDADKEFTTTPSGLKYKILRKGTGKKPTIDNTVLAHYRGWTDDGHEFDSSYKRGKPTPFPLSGVVRGWTEGIPHVAEGGKIELEIPPELGYGEQGAGPDIPPNATLHFIVELFEVR